MGATGDAEDRGPTVRAAGGFVWRSRSDDRPEVLLIHRPAYDDWTFPKGKLLPGERAATGALREVEEETGLRCRLGEPAGRVRYQDRKGRPKVVSYWLMTPVEGSFVPNGEVDASRWVTPEAALEMLTYEHDREALRRLAERLIH